MSTNDLRVLILTYCCSVDSTSSSSFYYSCVWADFDLDLVDVDGVRSVIGFDVDVDGEFYHFQ